MVGIHIPVDVGHTLCRLEHTLDTIGNGEACRIIGSIDLSHQRLQDRRTRGNFCDLDTRSEAGSDWCQLYAQCLGDVMALSLAFSLRQEVDLNIRLIGFISHKVMANKSIEVIRATGASIDLIVNDLLCLRDTTGQFTCNRERRFKGCSFWHVNNHLKLVLVVKGKHLNGHGFVHQQVHRPGHHNPDSDKEYRTHLPASE